jgi:hypothetical protein
MRELQAAVAVAAGVSADSTSAPQRWRPHVTLARRVAPADRDRVTEVAEAAHAHIGMRVVAPLVRRWDGARRVEWPISGRSHPR